MNLDDIRLIRRQVRSIVKKRKETDTFFVSKYSASPYMACSHGCTYCDGRAEKYQVEGDFERDIILRDNFNELLDKELSKVREKGYIHFCSGISDAYQHAEIKEKRMSKALETCLKYKQPASILTKSNLVLRDLDTLKQLSQTCGCIVMFSFTFIDDEKRKVFEPYSASVQERLKAIKILNDNGIPCGIMAMPFIPYIADSRDEVEQFTKALSDVNTQFAVPGELTLRPGRQKEFFFSNLAQFKEYEPKIRNLFSEERPSGVMKKGYGDKFYQYFLEIFLRYEIPTLIPHKLYKDKCQLYDEIYILYSHMIYLYSVRGYDVTSLKKSYKLYSDFISKKRGIISRKTGTDFSVLDNDILFMLKTGEFSQVVKNEKLAEFTKKIILDRQTLNYLNLKTT